jgi:hypothetical protein
MHAPSQLCSVRLASAYHVVYTVHRVFSRIGLRNPSGPLESGRWPIPAKNVETPREALSHGVASVVVGKTLKKPTGPF